MPRRRSSSKNCNTHQKKRTCPKKKCSWVKGRTNSNGKRVSPHCKGSPNKGIKRVSKCHMVKKSSTCRRRSNCNWVKKHQGRHGSVKAFCKNNPKKSRGRRSRSPKRRVRQPVVNDDSSSSDSDNESPPNYTDVMKMSNVSNMSQPVMSQGVMVPQGYKFSNVSNQGVALGQPQPVMSQNGFAGNTMQDLLMIKALGL